jgi:clan AA aspartic protease (TIGR02281 family)
MNRRIAAFALVILAMILSPIRAFADANEAEATLKAKGLKKSGSTYVLNGEGEVQKRINELRLHSKKLAAATAQQQAMIQQSVDNKQLIRELTEQRILINQQLAQQLPPQQHNQLVSMVNTVTDRLNLLQRQEYDPDAKRETDRQVGQVREAYTQAAIDLRQVVDKLAKSYDAILADSAVLGAIEELGKASKIKPTLGPSKNHLNNVKTLEKAESMVLTDKINLRREGGIFWLDVTFNGKVTKPMAFDTGASDVVLPYEFASSIGLTPGPDDPIVRCQVADGSIVEARRMTVPSMRVGKFTIQNVSCTVMPQGKKEVPPLLGQTFQKNFMFKFSADTGTLVLSRVEVPEPPQPGLKSKSTTKPAKRPTTAKP